MQVAVYRTLCARHLDMHVPQVVRSNCLCFLAGDRSPFGGMLKPLCIQTISK
jgi:hypothetical protein